jgi:hypothetical protein
LNCRKAPRFHHKKTLLSPQRRSNGWNRNVTTSKQRWRNLVAEFTGKAVQPNCSVYVRRLCHRALRRSELSVMPIDFLLRVGGAQNSRKPYFQGGNLEAEESCCGRRFASDRISAKNVGWLPHRRDNLRQAQLAAERGLEPRRESGLAAWPSLRLVSSNHVREIRPSQARIIDDLSTTLLPRSDRTRCPRRQRFV